MKSLGRFFCCIAFLLIFVSGRGLKKTEVPADGLNGSWINQSNHEEQVLLFIDGYNTQTIYSKSGKKFIETRGGTYTIKDNKLTIAYEFDTRDKEKAGTSVAFDFAVNNDEVTIQANGKKVTFKRIEDGTAPLAGLWVITGRMQEGKIVPIHRTGTRKTIKILSGSRFQWAAIDPGKKDFSGTGGGSYEFANGKYTEHIDFFSRDSSRIGASLSFDGKLENGDWHHSGLSSKGDKIYEIWSRIKQ
ncbi:MAG: hypothetical protein WKI04_13635 [Ferruginibacter sp.]